MIQYASIFLFALGFYGLFVNKNVIKLIVSLNVMEIGLFLFIVSIGFVSEGIAPIVSSIDELGLIYVDPIPQALVLTAIVIGVGTTALGLAISKKIYDTYLTLELDELEANL
jgi:multicomponent Na+:H+ antiporter subunit C